MDITSGKAPKNEIAPETKAVEDGPRRADGVTQLCRYRADAGYVLSSDTLQTKGTSSIQHPKIAAKSALSVHPF